LKITTWNVNGLRAALEKGVHNWIQENNADIICFQEIKAKPEQLPDSYRQELGGYAVIWNPAERGGYSGVATLYKNQPLSIITDIGVDKFNVEGRVIGTKYPDFLLFNVYFPNGQRDEERLTYKLDFYAHFLEMCDRLHDEEENIIICGDFNTAHREIDLRNPKENEKNSGFLPEERAWIDKYLEHKFFDVYRYLYPDKVEYTWWTYRFGARARNVGWRLDYFLVSETMLGRVKDVVIHNEINGSDHCPVSMFLD